MTQRDSSADHALPKALAAAEDLRDLAAPPSGARTASAIIMSLTVIAAFSTLISIRGDLQYFAASRSPSRLGEAVKVDPAALVSNSYAVVEGAPMLAHTVEYKRAVSGTTYVVFPLAGQRTVFVEMPESMADDPGLIASREFAGRLVTFGELGGRFSEVRSYLEESLGMPVTSETFLLRVGESPQHYTWALALAALCVLLMVLNAFFLIRWYRPLPVQSDEPAK